MIAYRVFKHVNEEKIENYMYVNFSDAKAQCEKMNDREENMFQKWKLNYQLKGKKYPKPHPDRWKVEEVVIYE